MQRNHTETSSLGYVRRQMPDRSFEGSRGRYAAPPTQRAPAAPVPGAKELKAPSLPRGATLHEEATGAPSAVAAVSLKAEALEALLRETAGQNKQNTQELSSTQNRVDQLSLKLSAIDSALNASEKAVLALREEHNSVVRTSGGQTAERVDALARQVQALEAAFCDYSTQSERKQQDLQARCERLALEGSAPASAGEPLETLTARVAACEELCRSTAARPTDGACSQEELREWVRKEVVPDLKRSVAQADRSEAVNAVSMGVHEQVWTRLRADLPERFSAMREAAVRATVPLRATVVKPTRGKEVGDSIELRHPIQELEGTYYMQRLHVGAGASVTAELFPVADADGPLVVFDY